MTGFSGGAALTKAVERSLRSTDANPQVNPPPAELADTTRPSSLASIQA
jgi:hypothetical protein